MNSQRHTFVTMGLMVIVQAVICNYLNLSQYAMLTVLPVLALCIPLKYNTISAMVIAFVIGLAVDFFSDGVLGLNVFSLVPVAFCRKGIILLIFGSEIFARKEDISIKKHGRLKMDAAIVISCAIFLILYIWLDGAMMRSFVFNLTKFSLSLLLCSTVCILISPLIVTTNKNR